MHACIPNAAQQQGHTHDDDDPRHTAHAPSSAPPPPSLLLLVVCWRAGGWGGGRPRRRPPGPRGRGTQAGAACCWLAGWLAWLTVGLGWIVEWDEPDTNKGYSKASEGVCLGLDSGDKSASVAFFGPLVNARPPPSFQNAATPGLVIMPGSQIQLDRPPPRPNRDRSAVHHKSQTSVDRG